MRASRQIHQPSEAKERGEEGGISTWMEKPGRGWPWRSHVLTLFLPSPLSPAPGHLKEPEHPSMWGPVELVGIIAGPVFLLFLIIIIVFLVINYHQRVYHNRQRLDMEDPSCEMCLSKDKTLQDLVYDLSTSGSGSGTASSGLVPVVSLPRCLPARWNVQEEGWPCAFRIPLL